ncbi:acyl-CoA dehydrogenase family protein [bacterium]|nr:acyl-CoA dehydrogenase family protein [bacterium]
MIKSNLTEDQKLIRDMVSDFAEKELQDRAAEIDQNPEFPLGEIKKMSQIGLLGLAIPEKYKGSEVDTVSILLAAEEISKYCAATSLIFVVHNLLVARAVNQFGTESQRQKYLAPLATGEILGGVSLVEPDLEGHITDISLISERKGNDFLLNGEKQMVLGGENAGLFVLFARDEEMNIRVFLIDKDLAGCMISENERTMGIRGAQCSRLVFKDCIIPDTALLGSEADQLRLFKEISEYGKLGVAASAIGIAKMALKKSVAYSLERKQFDQPIAEFEGLRWMLADMETSLASAEKNLYYAAALKVAGEPAGMDCAIAKLTAAEAAVKVTLDAIQMHGGYGYMKDFALERFFRDAKATEFILGNFPVQKTIISNKLLGK